MNLFTDDARISSKAALKEAPGKQDYRLAFRLIFGLGEEAAKGGGYAEEWKEIRRAARALRDFWQFGMHAGKDASVAAHRCHVFKAVGLAAPVAIVAWRNRIEPVAAFVLAIVLIEHYQFAGIVKRQRPQQHCTHHGEERCSRADAQRHHQHGDDRKFGRA